MLMTIGGEREKVARFLLIHTVNFVDSELVETDEEMKEFDLVLRILGEEGSENREDRQAISNAFQKLAMSSTNSKTMWRTSWKHEIGLPQDSGSD